MSGPCFNYSGIEMLLFFSLLRRCFVAVIFAVPGASERSKISLYQWFEVYFGDLSLFWRLKRNV